MGGPLNDTSTSAEDLKLCGKNYEELPPELRKYKKLKYLDVSNNNLVNLPGDFVEDQPSLEELDLSNNNFQEIPEEMREMKSLRRFAMPGNNIARIPENMGDSMANLVDLDLSNNNINVIPSSFAGMKGLRKLQLQDNRISTLPVEVQQLQNLEKLDLSRNEMSELPESVCKMQSLRYLYINENNLSEVPDEIKQLTQLQFFSLFDNQLEEIPESVGKLTNLCSLNVHGNAITKVSPNIIKLQQLEILYMSHCRQGEAPQTVLALMGLKELYLYGNGLTSMPEEVGQLKGLAKCDLDNNKLQKLPHGFTRLTVLRQLKLNHNRFEEFPQVVTTLVKLQELSIQHNRVQEIPTDIGNMKELKILEVDYNKLDDDAMEQLSSVSLGSLKKISVEGNNVTKMPPNLENVTSGMEDAEPKEPDEMKEEYGMVVVPNNKKLYRKMLPSDFYLEVPPSTITKSVSFTAETVVDPNCHPEEKEFGKLESHVIDLRVSSDSVRFTKPLTLGLRVRPPPAAVHFVILKNHKGLWQELHTIQDKERVSAKITGPGRFAVVSRSTRQTIVIDEHGKTLGGQGNLTTSLEIPPGALTKSVELSVQLLDKDPIPRSELIVFGGAILIERPEHGVYLEEPATVRLPYCPKLDKSLKHSSGASPSDKTPEDTVTRLFGTGPLNQWIDVTDIEKTEFKNDDKVVVFSPKYLKSYVVLSYSSDVRTYSVRKYLAEKVESLARGDLAVSVFLLQHVDNPRTLLIDIIEKEKLKNSIDYWKDRGYQSLYGDDGANQSRDAVISNGVHVSVLSAKLKGGALAAAKKKTFFLNKRNYLLAYIKLKEQYDNNGFLKIRVGEKRIKLRFKIPPEVARETDNNISTDKTTEEKYKKVSEELQEGQWQPVARVLGIDEFEIERLTYTYEEVKTRVFQMLILWEQQFKQTQSNKKLDYGAC
ncbi:protein scribble homolog [Ptychodera flava]|uniref:protein scribble homolog n=1 Tax=Ptychodera flava TaxID=63121 RepID=UPI00396A97C0